jgi:hypothetical protein
MRYRLTLNAIAQPPVVYICIHPRFYPTAGVQVKGAERVREWQAQSSPFTCIEGTFPPLDAFNSWEETNIMPLKWGIIG